MENEFLVNSLIIGVKQIIKEKIDKEIEEEVNKFREKLESRKDDYIAEVMKGIRICHEYNDVEHCMNYKITFENVTKVEPRETRYVPDGDYYMHIPRID